MAGLVVATAGKELRRMRVRARLSQQELAGKVGVTPTQISRYERLEQNAGMTTLRKIAEALNVDVEKLIKQEEE